MKRLLTNRRLLWFLAALFVVLILFLEFGCTKRDEAAARAAGAAVGTVLGLPPVVGDSIVAGLLLLSHAAAAKMGHGRGRRVERNCHTPKATTP